MVVSVSLETVEMANISTVGNVEVGLVYDDAGLVDIMITCPPL